MAIFRKIHVSFWGDSWASSLAPEQRYFFLYLLTNEKTTQCGIYEITKKQIAFDTGYSIDKVSILIKFFERENKIRYNDKTNELAIKNWKKYNGSTSPKVKTLTDKEFEKVKDRVLIEYLDCIDTCLQEEEEREEEETREIKEEKEVLIFPFYSSEFMQVWNTLIKTKKWRKKEFPALQASLKLLSGRPESEAIKMMENSIAGEWQGLFELKDKQNGNNKTGTTDSPLRQASDAVLRAQGFKD